MNAARAVDEVDRVYASRGYGTFPWDRRRTSRVTMAVVRQVARPGMVVLDLGCGSGFWLEVLRALSGEHVHGVDRSWSAVRAVAAGGASCLRGDILALPCRTGSADLLFLSGVLHHVADPERAVREAARVLRPDGLLLIEVYNARHPWFWLVHRAAAPLRWLYWSGARWLLHPLRWMSALVLQPFSLVTSGRPLDRATLDVMVLDQVLNPIAELFTAKRLRALCASAGLTIEQRWSKQGGLLRGVLARARPTNPPAHDGGRSGHVASA